MSPTRKVLYLDPDGALTVSREGPALRVARPQRAARWYPLARLARIVSRRSVSWESDALLACLDARVPVIFLDPEGTVCGICIGRADDVAGLQAHLDVFLSRPDWREGWNNWFRAQERRMILNLHLALGWPMGDLRPAQVGPTLDRAVAVRLGPEASRKVLGRLRSLLAAQVLDVLERAGIEPQLAIGQRGELNLARELTRLMSWPLRGRVFQSPPHGTDLESLASHYQARLEDRLDRTLRRLIQALWRLGP
jgi:hypothetical protein